MNQNRRNFQPIQSHKWGISYDKPLAINTYFHLVVVYDHLHTSFRPTVSNKICLHFVGLVSVSYFSLQEAKLYTIYIAPQTVLRTAVHIMPAAGEPFDRRWRLITNPAAGCLLLLLLPHSNLQQPVNSKTSLSASLQSKFIDKPSS